MDNDTICDGELVFTIDFGLMYSVANLDNDDDSSKYLCTTMLAEVNKTRNMVDSL